MRRISDMRIEIWSQADGAVIAFTHVSFWAAGRSRYFEEDRSKLRTEYDNVFVIRFAPDGRAREFAEWFIEKPAAQS